ncbi:flagellar export chaperone FliS [Cronobacter dublinensis]|uniref:Flagellar secretion chaperone FliS n=1 Tax=Cronobacter dublinensis 1210 TaxID=1208656 RepID=A0ABP1WHG3_9ENTR|nr:flagellar export chaperone FliS [Cronobacter dublinensis]EGT5710020.1 flagella export chaperone FliS [Cronobacter dublinensis subsp. dublinensis]CCJ83231.1 Flagellar biosynthesis protein FliS [Cronobacter dublinensis 1210]ALB67297.1 flagellar protein FliS [Cronobacter dublinensis subsp. dublinensis LMG 23823]EGT5738369.1 flagella export chaperone FliS [Cronobacter dublinensis subsp. dublinensis]EKF2279888.1 flagellar export chaperone FliS [Cronobacter dublinensis]
MYNSSGVQAYQQVGLESAVMSASPHQLVVMLFDGALSALVRARLFIEQGDTQAKGQALTKAINIIDNGLKAGLNMDIGGDLPQNLASLYEYMVRRLLHANLRNDVDAITEVETLMTNIADAWKQIGPGSTIAQETF